MIEREDIVNAFKYILGRLPESESTINKHMEFNSLDGLRLALFKSEEFIEKNSYFVETDKWVYSAVHKDMNIWLNLNDQYVSAGCLMNNWEPSETKFIRSNLQKNDFFIDIGANIGWFTHSKY